MDIKINIDASQNSGNYSIEQLLKIDCKPFVIGLHNYK